MIVESKIKYFNQFLYINSFLIIRSNDGKILAISSRDGYCSLVTFDDNELGIPYNQTASEVIENKTLQKEVSPCRKPVGRPRSKTPGKND